MEGGNRDAARGSPFPAVIAARRQSNATDDAGQVYGIGGLSQKTEERLTAHCAPQHVRGAPRQMRLGAPFALPAA